MSNISYLKDADFLKALITQRLKTYFVRILVLSNDENPIEEIQGRISSGSVEIDGNSAVRRTCNLTFLVREEETDLTNLTLGKSIGNENVILKDHVENLLSADKKIKIEIGLENSIDDSKDKIIWFNQGIFVITQISISHSLQGVTVSLSGSDKMVLLNGTFGGNLPAPITFDPQYVWKILDEEKIEKTLVEERSTLHEIIRTLLINFGGESADRIIINDVPLEIKQICTWGGTQNLYYNEVTKQYTTDQPADMTNWKEFVNGEEIGYRYEKFYYPGDGLISGMNGTITEVLDTIKNALGNYEYFYDLDGNFVFQEIRNYLNTSYLPVATYDENGNIVEFSVTSNDVNYYIDLADGSKSVFVFENDDANRENNLLISAASAPVYTEIKNDFHIWGKESEGYKEIHYHLALKSKPKSYLSSDNKNIYSERRVVFLTDENNKSTGELRLTTFEEDKNSENFVLYQCEDWRAELYLRGLEKRKNGLRPDIFEEELLNLFDAIYNFKEKKYKADIIKNPSAFTYFLDFIEPTDGSHNCSIDAIGIKTYSYEQEKICKIYDSTTIPNVILVKNTEDIEKKEGEVYAPIDEDIFNKINNVFGYSAHAIARDLLYQNTEYDNSISIQTIPVYYLEPNTRISVYDNKTGINGDYIIERISMPLDSSSPMDITAKKALDRI